MTALEIDQAVAERAAETRFAGWRHDCCKWCGEPRMALDIECAREVARGHAGTCLGQRADVAVGPVMADRGRTT